MFVCCQPLHEHPWVHSLLMPLSTPRIASLSERLFNLRLALSGSTFDSLYTNTAAVKYNLGDSMGHGADVNLS